MSRYYHNHSNYHTPRSYHPSSYRPYSGYHPSTSRYVPPQTYNNYNGYNQNSVNSVDTALINALPSVISAIGAGIIEPIARGFFENNYTAEVGVETPSGFKFWLNLFPKI